MAPTIPEDDEAFLDELASYHERRGTNFDREPKVAGRSVNLHKLYRTVMENGGYDVLSAERMRWRTLVKGIGLGGHHEAANTFQMKTVYYKYLAAYEISKYWHETPPPPEVLENLTAKGGDLRQRTIENFHPPNSRDSGGLADGVDSADEEQRTPKADTMDVDEPGSTGRYPTRQLRQDPKKTQLFQPDLAPGRRGISRTTTSPQASPAPAPTYNNASADPRNPSFSLDRYEPRQPMALTLRPVVTPGNNPDVFRQRKAMLKAQNTPRPAPEVQHYLKSSIPNNMNGPNIYLRCLYGLRSGIPEEQDFALHHLVKVSFERGDKYKFEGFPLLAESLLEKALEITQLVYDIKWEVSYDEDADTESMNTLNASYGTPQLLERINALKVRIKTEEAETAEFLQRLDKLNEAALVIRNMVILEENALFVSKLPLMREFLIIAINLPEQPRLAEFRHYAIEMAEQVTRYWDLSPRHPLYTTLLKQVDRADRADILPALRAIVRLSMETQKLHQLVDVPTDTAERIISFLLLEVDDDLTSASLDFLYQYTAIQGNMDLLLNLSSTLIPSIVTRLSNLLLHSARPFEEKIMVRAAQKQPASAIVPSIPDDLYQALLQIPEPDRSSRWLQCCFEESVEDDVTQIAIWQAYQSKFMNNNLVPAAEFIKNVSSNTFKSAQAQVINGPQPRFIIKGIRPRRVLLNLAGKPHLKCLWEVPVKPDGLNLLSNLPRKQACGEWRSSPQNLWSHVLTDHLAIQRAEEGEGFSNDASGSYLCRWTGCLHSPTPFTTPRDIGIHVRMHMPVPPAESDASKPASDIIREPEYTRHTFYSSTLDEKNNPAGIGWTSIMIMRNVARYANRHQQLQRQSSKSSLMEDFFGHVKMELWRNVSVSRTLTYWLHDLMKMVTKNESLGYDPGIQNMPNGLRDAAMA